MADGKFVIEIDVAGNGQAKIKQLSDNIKEFSETGSKSLGGFTDAFNVFSGTLAANVALDAFKAMAGAAADFAKTLIVDGISAATQSEDAINKLNSALRLGGQYSKETSNDLLEFAGALQATTKFSDDAIVETQAYLAALTNLDKDGLKAATQAAVDMSAALGIDLHAATTLVGKAANGEVGAFKRYGIAIEEGSSKADTFARALRQLNDQFGGSASAQVNTFSGATAVLANQYDDLLEAIGGVVIKNPVLIELMKDLAEVFGGLAKWVETNRTEISAYISQGLIIAIQAVQLAIPVFQTLSTIVLRLAQAMVVAQAPQKTFADTLRGLVSGEGGLTAAKKSITETKDSFLALGKAVENVQSSSTLEGLNEVLAKIEMNAQAAATRSDETTERQINNMRRVQEESELIDIEKLFAQDEYAIEVENRRIAEFEKEIQDLMARNQALAALDRDKNAERIAANNELIDSLVAGEKRLEKTALEIQKTRAAEEEKISRERMGAAKDALNDLAYLQNSKSKEMAAIGKAAAITSTIISTYEGAQKAYTALAGIPLIGPGLGFAAAGAAIVGGFARVRAIQGTPLATGITEVPAGFPNDTFPARLTSGERVVDQGTNQDLKGFLSSGGNAELLMEIRDALYKMENRTTVNVGSRTIVDEVRSALRAGRSIEA